MQRQLILRQTAPPAKSPAGSLASAATLHPPPDLSGFSQPSTRGRGPILRGARAQTETKGRHPYLTAKDAEELVAQSITTYKAHHRHVPARVVVLKPSRFRPEEAEGIDAALKKFGIEMADLLWVQGKLAD